MSAKRKLAAILAADVAGYSRLMADDETGTLHALNDARVVFRTQIEAHGGHLIDTAGDSVLAEFPSAVEAVACAVEVQQELARRNDNLHETRRMLFRAGVNLGDVIEEDGGLYGDGVNVAARLQALAEPGGLCISGTVFDQVEGKLPLAFKSIGEQTVKNIPKPVRVYRLTGEAAATTVSRTRPRARALVGVVAILAGLAAISWWYLAPTTPTAKSGSGQAAAPSGAANTAPALRPRLAVLPLANISANAEDEYFSDGMTEELISKLSRVRGLDVIARTSVMQYKGKEKSIADIGRELNVSTVLEGSVRKAGNQVRITVQLIDVSSQGHLWSEDYDRELKDVFATQSDISDRVVKALHLQLRVPEQRSGQDRDSGDVDTYTLYLKGRYHWGKTTPEGLKKSIEYFERAIAESPDDVRPWVGLADSYAMLGWMSFVPPAESFPKAKAAAERALALDESRAEAHASLGLVRFLFEWDWVGAEQAYRRALELSPSYANGHLFYGVWFKAMGMNDQAVAEIRRANELDPLSLMANAEIGWVAYYGRRFDEAAQSCRRTLEMDPNYVFALMCLQYALVLKKDPEAISVGKKLVEVTSGDPYMLGSLGWAYGVFGNKLEARRILEQLTEMARASPIPPAAVFYVHLGLGELDRTIDGMEQAYRERWADVVWLKTDPGFDALRASPRFDALLKKLRFDRSPGGPSGP